MISLKFKFSLIKRSVLLELKGIVRDILNFIINIKNCSDYVVVVDYDYLYGNKSQVASQRILVNEIVNQVRPLVIHSFIGYILFSRNCKYVFCHEMGWSAPFIVFRSSKKKVLLFMSDMHNKFWLPKYLSMSNVYKILTPYKSTIPYISFLDSVDDSIFISFPWSIPDEWMGSVIVEKPSNNNVSIFGAMGHSDAYEFRRWIASQSIVDKSYNFGGSENYIYKENAYFEWLQSMDAIIVATGNGIYNCSVAKLIEVPASGALMFASKTHDFGELGFEDNINCIVIDKNNFQERILKYKSNPNEYLDIRRRGVELIKSNHLVSHRVKKVINCFKGDDYV